MTRYLALVFVHICKWKSTIIYNKYTVHTQVAFHLYFVCFFSWVSRWYFYYDMMMKKCYCCQLQNVFLGFSDEIFLFHIRAEQGIPHISLVKIYSQLYFIFFIFPWPLITAGLLRTLYSHMSLKPFFVASLNCNLGPSINVVIHLGGICQKVSLLHNPCIL